MRDYSGFGNDPKAVLEYFKDRNGTDCIGERNSENKLHGRGIKIYSFGRIHIGYWNNGEHAPGNFIWIDSDGEYRVGEMYFKDGKMCWRGTVYKEDGTSQKY